MDETFRAELQQASEVWRSGMYVITPLETSDDIQTYVRAGKTFWIRADRYWVAYYAAIVILAAIKCTLHSGRIALFNLDGLNKDEVKSLDTLRQLYVWYWNLSKDPSYEGSHPIDTS